MNSFPFPESQKSTLTGLFNINVRGGLVTVEEGLPRLNNGGSIILTGSRFDLSSAPGHGSQAQVQSIRRLQTAIHRHNCEAALLFVGRFVSDIEEPEFARGFLTPVKGDGG